MGDRSQLCIKQGTSRVYLYSHWGGTDIYIDAAHALQRVPGRWTDQEYLARAMFCQMVGAKNWLEETGYGIGTDEHGDTEHAIPVFDCAKQQVTWENTETEEPACTFKQFAERALTGKFQSF